MALCIIISFIKKSMHSIVWVKEILFHVVAFVLSDLRWVKSRLGLDFLSRIRDFSHGYFRIGFSEIGRNGYKRQVRSAKFSKENCQIYKSKILIKNPDVVAKAVKQQQCLNKVATFCSWWIESCLQRSTNYAQGIVVF